MSKTRWAPVGSRVTLTCGVALVAGLQLSFVGSLSCQPAEDPSPYSVAELIPEVRSMRPGESFTVALSITLDPGWHSYWQNPGDAGHPASIDWELPAGFRAGEIQWPYPRTVEESTVVSYGYDDEVVLLTEITPPRFMTTGHVMRFAAEARWLVCNDICLPASEDLEFELRLSDKSPVSVSRWESLFVETRSKLPKKAGRWEMNASFDGDSIVLQIIQTDVPSLLMNGAHFFAGERGVIAHGAPQVVTQSDGVTRISLRKSRFLRSPPDRLKGVLVLPDFVNTGAGRARALVVDAIVSESAMNEMDVESRGYSVRY